LFFSERIATCDLLLIDNGSRRSMKVPGSPGGLSAPVTHISRYFAVVLRQVAQSNTFDVLST